MTDRLALITTTYGALMRAFNALGLSPSISIAQVGKLKVYDIRISCRAGRFNYFAHDGGQDWMLAHSVYGERVTDLHRKLEIAVINAFINEITVRMHQATEPCADEQRLSGDD